ncbi:MAG: GspE/PulE family protein, partial [Candidatus Paceibacteria bacterium]
SYKLKDAPVSKIVSVILKNAIEGGASDIHIEGQEENIRVRFRVDGILHTSLILPKNVQSSVVARIKILSDMKIDEHRKPQDGRFKIIHEGHKIDFRVSTLPTAYGEKVVARILDTSEGIKELPELGFVGPKADHVRDSIKAPYGITLVTGPTGSGKSTTLYTLLSMVKGEEVNIVTLEDPVEYYISGVNQSQVHAEIGYTFASGLRSILRQDPDIIMVGEIRDGETAGLAVQSALTGHLVFSTLHTNDSVGAVPRLIDMNVEPFLLSASINLVIAQRLVRTLCDECKQEVEMSEERREYIKGAIDRLSDDLVEALYDGDFSTLYEPGGCKKCSDGFKGRVAVFEALKIDQTLRANIEEGFHEEEFNTYLKKNDFITLKQDGLFKV